MTRVAKYRESAIFLCLAVALFPAGCSKTADSPATTGNEAATRQAAMHESITKGDSYFARTQYKQAADSYNQAIKESPEQPVPRFACAHTLFALEEYDRAYDSIEKGLLLMPKWPRSGIDLQAFFQSPIEFQDKLFHLDGWVTEHPGDRK